MFCETFIYVKTLSICNRSLIIMDLLKLCLVTFVYQITIIHSDIKSVLQRFLVYVFSTYFLL